MENLWLIHALVMGYPPSVFIFPLPVPLIKVPVNMCNCSDDPSTGRSSSDILQHQLIRKVVAYEDINAYEVLEYDIGEQALETACISTESSRDVNWPMV